MRLVAAAPLLTPELPIVPRKGHLAITDRYPEFCRHQLVELGYLASAHAMTNESVAFNVQPRSDGPGADWLVARAAGVGRRGSTIRSCNECSVAPYEFLAGVCAISRSSDRWTGFRPATPDKLPLDRSVGRRRRACGSRRDMKDLGSRRRSPRARPIADQLAGPRIGDRPRCPYSADAGSLIAFRG